VYVLDASVGHDTFKDIVEETLAILLEIPVSGCTSTCLFVVSDLDALGMVIVGDTIMMGMDLFICSIGSTFENF
jgi:hypothetical protein